MKASSIGPCSPCFLRMPDSSAPVVHLSPTLRNEAIQEPSVFGPGAVTFCALIITTGLASSSNGAPAGPNLSVNAFTLSVFT